MARTNTAPAHAPEGMPRARAWVEHLDRLPNVFFLPFGHIPSLASSLRAAVHEADRLSEQLATLRRQLEAAEAQAAEVWLCEKDGAEPEPWATLEAAQADALASWDDAPYTMRWREEGATYRLYADDTWTHSVIWRAPIRSGTEPNPTADAVTEARADIAVQPADPEPAPIRHAWLIEAGDD